MWTHRAVMMMMMMLDRSDRILSLRSEQLLVFDVILNGCPVGWGDFWNSVKSGLQSSRKK